MPYPRNAIIEALAQIEQQAYWEAHEVLEDVWVELAPGYERSGFAALIQFCAAAHKFRQCREGKPEQSMQRGLQKLCESALKHLEDLDSSHAPERQWPVLLLRDALCQLGDHVEVWRTEGIDSAEQSTHQLTKLLAHGMRTFYAELQS